MDFLEKIRNDAQYLADEMNLILYDVEWIANEKTLRISLDIPDQMIDVDTCSSFSDKISEILDEKDYISQNYYLEVCSPGAERKLRNPDEIKAAIGNYVYVKMYDPKEGMDDVEGDLIEADEEHVTVSYKDKTRNKTINIEMTNIRLIRLAIKF